MSSTWPIHWAVFTNRLNDLKSLLENSYDLKSKLDEKDPRGRTPLMLAVTLGHLDCAKVLLEAGSNPNIEDSSGFNVLQEALTLGDHEFVADVLQRRDFHRYCSRVDGVPAALLRLRDTKDFYFEMRWEFTSWLPVVSSFCPSDTYKIYKRGSKVRFDTTLVGFDQNTWQRGLRSYVFSCDEGEARFMEFDHESRRVHVESMKTMDPNAPEASAVRQPAEMISKRMSSPMSITYLNTDKITFERAKSGLIGFRQDRTENINGYDCKVFYAAPLEIVTKCRTEHLSPEDKEAYKSSLAGKKAPFLNQLFGADSFFGETIEGPTVNNQATVNSSRNIHNVTPEEYFDENIDLTNREIGVPREVSTKIQRFKASLWLCNEYPLSLQEQILPVVDLMAMSSGHFAKYRDFINLHLPTGFPVRIEIPLFRVLHAKITFGNIFALETPVDNVLTINDDIEVACVIDDSVFAPPPGYEVIGKKLIRLFIYLFTYFILNILLCYYCNCILYFPFLVSVVTYCLSSFLLFPSFIIDSLFRPVIYLRWYLRSKTNTSSSTSQT